MGVNWWESDKVKEIAHDVRRALEQQAVTGGGKMRARALAAAAESCNPAWDKETRRRYVRAAIKWLRKEIGERLCSDNGGYWIARDGLEWERNEQERRLHPVGVLVNIARTRDAARQTHSGQLVLPLG